MSDFILEHEHVTIVPRPDSVVEWADCEAWLSERLARLVPLLMPPDHVARNQPGDAWTIGDPTFDFGVVSVELSRPLRISDRADETATLNLWVSVLPSSDEQPPAQLQLQVNVTQELEIARPTLRDRVESLVITGGALGSAAAAGWRVWHSTDSLVLAFVAAFLAFVGVLVALVLLVHRLPNRARAELAARKPAPSADYVALIAAVSAQFPAST